MHLLSIIIVTYNAKYFTEQCLHTVGIATADLASETIVVDNASTDGTLTYLQPNFPNVAFIANTANNGFASACNLGAAKATGEFLLFLNPDTLIDHHALRHGIAVLKESEKNGACGIRMVDGSGAYLPESKRGFPWLQTSLYKLAGLYRLFPRHKSLAAYYLGHLPQNQDAEVEVMAGAFILTKRKAFEAIGGFDERYFMYGEDIDLSFALVKSGYRNLYIGTQAIIHFKGESTQRLSPQYVERFYGAMQLFVDKHYAGIKKNLYKVFVQTASTLSGIKQQVLRRSGKAAPQVMKRILVVHAANDNISSADNILQAQQSVETISYLTPEMLMQQAIQPGDAILFCLSSSLITTDCIGMMQQIGASHLYLFHHVGSFSIVGSPAKDKQGIVMISE